MVQEQTKGTEKDQKHAIEKLLIGEEHSGKWFSGLDFLKEQKDAEMSQWQVHKETRLACKIVKNRREKG